MPVFSLNSSAYIVASVVILAAHSATGKAQSAVGNAQERSVTLSAAEWSAAEGLSVIRGIGALADGRVLIADQRERLVYIASRDGSLSTFGSTGEGPGEYRSVFTITRAAGDTLLVYDAINRRMLRVAPDGKQGADINLPIELLRAGGLAPVAGRDANGRLYWDGDAMGELNGMPKRAAVHRVRAWVPGETTVTIVAPLRDHADARHAQRFHPLSARDAYVVAPDGRVGVLSATDYRLRWYRANSLVSEGPALSYTPVPVTQREREAFRLKQSQQPASGMRGPPGQSAEERRVVSPQIREAFPDELFPATLPPFDAESVRRAPNGDVWATRSASAGTRAWSVDIIREDGQRRAVLRLPEGRRLVAVEREGIYLARVDEDGLEWLERYAYPAGLR
jgi:hypothetical protein